MSETATIFIVDDDPAVRDSLTLLLGASGLRVETYASARAFLEAYTPERPGCLLLDVRMPGMSGLELQAELAARGVSLPIIFITAHGDVPMSARAFRTGAVDFLEKPLDHDLLLQRIREAVDRDAEARRRRAERAEYRARLARLTRREREVLTYVVQGKSNKEIARALDVSHRTVEAHRARLMDKMEVQSLPALVEIAVTCGLGDTEPTPPE